MICRILIQKHFKGKLFHIWFEKTSSFKQPQNRQSSKGIQGLCFQSQSFFSSFLLDGITPRLHRQTDGHTRPLRLPGLRSYPDLTLPPALTPRTQSRWWIGLTSPTFVPVPKHVGLNGSSGHQIRLRPKVLNSSIRALLAHGWRFPSVPRISGSGRWFTPSSRGRTTLNLL